MARAEKLRRLSTTLRQFGDYQIRNAECLDEADAGAMRAFGLDNQGAADWLETLADATTRPTSPECIELQCIDDLAADALCVANRVSVRVDVRAREGARVGAGQLAALRELCTTAPAVIGYLLERRREDQLRSDGVGAIRRQGPAPADRRHRDRVRRSGPGGPGDRRGGIRPWLIRG